MADIYDNVLHGRDDTPRIVGVQALSDDPQFGGEKGGPAYMRLYIRDEDDKLRHEDVRHYPFFHLSDITLLRGFDRNRYKFKRLTGSGFYQFIVVFESWSDFFDARRKVQDNTGQKAPRELHIIWDKEQQYLSQSGRTLFKGMSYDDPVRLELDIEAFGPTGFPNAKRKSNVAFIVSMTSNRGFKSVLYIGDPDLYTEEERFGEYSHVEACRDEEDLLRRLNSWIGIIDPDIIEGHNIFGFDLPYLHTRMKRYELPMAWGRDGSEPNVFEGAKIKFAERDIEFARYTFAGRHVVDTMFMCMSYDVVKRDLPGYGLKVIAKYFDLVPEGRTYVEGDQIASTWLSDPRKIIDYALDDVIECGAISGRLGGSLFYMTQMCPMTYQEVGTSGVGKRIESLLVREYIVRHASLPKADLRTKQDITRNLWIFDVKESTSQQEVGGYTDVFHVGRYENIIYLDVASLYPSIMETFKVMPQGDDLGVFQNNLVLLKTLRFKTKALMTEWEKKRDAAKTPKAKQAAEAEVSKYDNMQSSYKNIINSCYGVLGFRFALFNDYVEADRVTTIGQLILKRMAQCVRDDGGQVIEVDTDGILAIPPPFVYRSDDPPADVAGMMSDKEYAAHLSSRVPAGIEIDHDGNADVMVSMKRKNYAMREPGKDGKAGKVKMKGGSLKSRTIQKYRRDFMEEVVKALLDKDTAEIHRIYQRYWLKIVSHDWSPVDFGSVATIKDPIETYQKKVDLGHGQGGRHKSAAYELAAARSEDTGIPVRQGDRIRYYVAYPADETSKRAYKVKVFEDAAFAEDWDPANPNENTNWYLKALVESAKRFRVYFSPSDWKLLFSEEEDPDVDYGSIEILSKEVKRKPLKVIIAGSRCINSMFWIERAIAGAKFLREHGGDVRPAAYEIAEVVCGMADGADLLGKEWAEANGIPVTEFPADWDNLDVPGAVVKTRRDGKKYNARAGHMRNTQMAEYADALICVWDAESPGSLHMLNEATRLKLKRHLSLVPKDRLAQYRTAPMPASAVSMS